MGDRHDYVALDWVKGEISETLNQSRQALEAFVENPEDTTRLRFCLTYIHQVHGTLQMVEFYGAALLAEEMEKLAQALMHGACNREHEALEVLMQGILQMPTYLDRVQRGRRDLPLLLLPLLNDMRTARGEKLLSESALFSPVLNVANNAGATRQIDFSSDQSARQLRKLRQAMQIAHAAIIRDQNVPASSRQLGRVFTRLESLFQGTRFAELWRVFAGVAEGLELGTIDNSAAIRQLLRQADRELRLLQDDTAAIGDRTPAPELLRNLLFYVAKSSGTSARLVALKKHYQLNTLWSDADRHEQVGDSRMVGPDRGTMRSVIQALDEELLQVKERLDLFVRSSDRRADTLKGLLPAMKRIADTLAVLGLGQPRRVLQEQVERVELLASADSAPDDGALLEIAGGVLYVEASMRGIFAMDRSVDAPDEDDEQPRPLAGAQDMRQIQRQVVLEARNALEQTRDAINAFIAGQWDHTQLEPVDDLLNSVRGGLAMLPLARAAEAVAACRLYLRQQLVRDCRVPDWEALDALADVITSIDYYLERVIEDNAGRGDSILAVAEQRLALLGYASADIAAALEGSPESGAEPIVAGVVCDVPDELAEDELDPELLEIFIEEVGEVLETLEEYTPRWQADAQDLGARAEVRRGFHTLKGSGRMVRARVLAELAWAVENMLNRVIDGKVSLTQSIFITVDTVRDLIPDLLNDFATGRQRQLPEVDRLASQADALSQGEDLPALESDVVRRSERADLAEAALPAELMPVVSTDLQAESEGMPAVDTPQAELDPLLLKIFRAETQTHIEQINCFLDKCDQIGLPHPLSDALQRALHTLKGSAHMAGIQPIAVLATPLEKLTKDFKGNLIPADQTMAALLRDAVNMLESWLARGDAASEQAIPDTDTFLLRLERAYQQGMQQRNNNSADQVGHGDADLLSIFLTEGVELLLDAADALVQGSAVATIDHAGLASALRALADVAAELELASIDELCQGLEDVHEALAGQRLLLSADVADCMARSHERLIDMMDQVAAHQHIQPANDELNALQALLQFGVQSAAVTPRILDTGRAHTDADTWSPDDADTDAELVDIFLEEAQGILDMSSSSLQHWLIDTSDEAPLHAVLRNLHTLKGGARMAEIHPVGDLTHELEFLYEGLLAHHFTVVKGLPELLLVCQDALTDMVEGLVAGRAVNDGMPLIRVIRDFRAQPDQPPRWPAGAAVDVEMAIVTETPTPVHRAALEADSDMLCMFIEEARELLLPCADLLMRAQTESSAAGDLIHRVQTLKGSARLAGHNAVAEQAWQLEQALQQAGQDERLLAMLAALHEVVEKLAEGRLLPNKDGARPAVASSVPLPVSPSAAPGRSLAEVQAILQQAMDAASPARSTGSRSGMQDTVKVSAALLEELVNLAGETSIYRARIEQIVSSVGITLADMDSTIERVGDQLRRLDMETQAQIMSRHQVDAGQGNEEFDPLEMDRYSQLQQLSRSLFESASDMLDLKETLASRARSSIPLMQQQERANTELQEGLMRTRMVPIERLLPRLRRVVRQVSTELGKQVSLVVGNAKGEMDRTTLERMMAPLEHMLRNAIDHGIELPELRVAQGKPQQGSISLDVHREGSEIIMRLHDDGRGVDLQAVRRKAIERGLMSADMALTDQELLQFILEAGFSTAQQVTQISGRGVGMDVVNAEVKQLGGSMTLATESGKGTTFVIRLPYTVSVSRALMVSCGKERFAIPLNTIGGIVRVSGYELEAYYAPEAPAFEYAGESYELRYIGDLLGTGERPKLSGHNLPLPVILVRGPEHNMALQVDALTGSREIVVKGLGRQFAVVPGITGATIIGDGGVVVILDLPAMIRAQQVLYSQQKLAAERAIVPVPQASRSTRVMVVDDSVTVRKVTSRLLERHGMEVVTAKDGIDAIAQLQDGQPDIMLLDIEMPRMDGFEVATLVRHDDRLSDLPIVMITSRTGEKHRERARSLGVDEYLGKPYQEAQLLEVIDSLVKQRE